MEVGAARSEVGRLIRVAMKHPRDAFVDGATIERQWRPLGFTAPPDLGRAVDEFDRLVEIIRGAGARVDLLPPEPGTTLDSIYTRDASLETARGMVLCAMGKEARATEPEAQGAAFASLGVPLVGRVRPPGRIEGGDVVWLAADTVVVGLGYRTNTEGIAKFRALLDARVHVEVVPLPHWNGPGDVMHLMSLLSPVDDDLAVVYSRLLPVPFREWLLARGIRLVEVPDEEFTTMGTNVLALAPRTCVMLDGNPRTRAALEKERADVAVYDGREISLKGGGGPTCLTRPLARA